MAVTTQPELVLGDDPVEEVHETHISRVFLTRERAYKVKKPLVLPYLDYGTPARRLAMCRAEVALNRRLAPDRYLGVRSLIPRSDGRLGVAREAEPGAVDYAVEMRRYPEEATLAARVAAGTAAAAELTAIGTRLARFHADAAADLRPNGAEAVKRSLDDNFATLRSLLRDPAERRAVARAERFATAFLEHWWDELDRRAAGGSVREGHGDLRLEHVLLERDVEVVDCVEFNAGLRRIDVAADLAFLVMELHEARRPDLATALVGGYRAAGGEPGSDALLAFFAAYRAQVRAKVALTRAQQLEPGAAACESRHAWSLLRLAERLQWAARAPLVVVIAGLSASGKTTLAQALAAASGYAHLSSDVVRKRGAGLAPTDRAPPGLYDTRTNLATYAELGRLAAAAAPAGAIVDATFRNRADRAAFREQLGSATPLLVVECRAPARVLEARARTRAAGPGAVSDAGPDVVREQLRRHEPLDDVPPRDHLPLRMERPGDELVAAIADALDRRLLDQ
jgi:aminoglycoside phosphotransferase family enzyme/predicted kinase